jgi:hypothetical protein
MSTPTRPFVHTTINAVDAVVFDPEGHYDPEFHDHYETFEAARDAALTSVEVMLDEGDYDGEDHREELDRMRDLLETARSFDDLERLPAYQWFLRRLAPSRIVAA